jgi:Ca-activated chloride channel family protein
MVLKNNLRDLRDLRVVIVVCAVLLGAVTAQTQSAVVPSPNQPVFSAKSELVVLHASVQDSRGRYVSGLGKEAFRVFENGEAQDIAMFSGEDVPATIGVLIDNSGSMQPSREMVVAGALAFSGTSHPEDEILVLTFNEHVRHAWGPVVVNQTTPAIFKSTVARAITATGMTAVYDAIVEGLNRVRNGKHSRQVLIVISDGGDNASTAKEADVIKLVHDSEATIYAVGLRDPVNRDGNPGLLRRLAKATGGSLVQPRRAAEMPVVLERIARDIRSAYTLAYAPSAATPSGARRMIRVHARSPDGKLLKVRTRDGAFLRTIAGSAGPP